MKTTIQQQDGNLVAVLEGRLDTAAAAATEKELQPLYDCEGKNIVFDCSKLEFISSSGLRLFLGVNKSGSVSIPSVFVLVAAIGIGTNCVFINI